MIKLKELLSEEVGVNSYWIYKHVSGNKNKFFDYLDKEQEKFDNSRWVNMLDYTLKDYNKENPNKYKTIKDKEEALFKFVSKKFESVNEATDFKVYHKSYTEAIQTAKEYALKKGYMVDDDDSFRKIGMGPRKPSEGKTNKVSVELTKGGKPSNKQLHIQVYGMKNGYELNCYIG
jgi:hypothetical protein